MSVTAIIVTRGDHDLAPVLGSLPSEWEVLVWDNGARVVHGRPHTATIAMTQDLGVYGRYAATAWATNPLIYVQDDDCVLPPESIEEIVWQSDSGSAEYGRLVCNQPAAFRHGFYDEHALVGFGACFHRDLPGVAFKRFWKHFHEGHHIPDWYEHPAHFNRACDVVFTALTPYTLVDVPYENLPWAEDLDRMYRQPGHVEERAKMLELAFRAKDTAGE